jgi:hypothetical protein
LLLFVLLGSFVILDNLVSGDNLSWGQFKFGFSLILVAQGSGACFSIEDDLLRFSWLLVHCWLLLSGLGVGLLSGWFDYRVLEEQFPFFNLALNPFLSGDKQCFFGSLL